MLLFCPNFDYVLIVYLLFYMFMHLHVMYIKRFFLKSYEWNESANIADSDDNNISS